MKFRGLANFSKFLVFFIQFCIIFFEKYSSVTRENSIVGFIYLNMVFHLCQLYFDSTVFTISFDIALDFSSSDIIRPISFITLLRPPPKQPVTHLNTPKQPVTIGIIITLCPGCLCLISNASCWYFCSFSACFVSTLFSPEQSISIRNNLFLFLYLHSLFSMTVPLSHLSMYNFVFFTNSSSCILNATNSIMSALLCLSRYSVAASLVHPDKQCISDSFACLHILHFRFLQVSLCFPSMPLISPSVLVLL